MAQSQLFTPEATGIHASSSDRLNVQVNLSENKRISDLSSEEESHSQIQGTNNTPLQSKKMPRQGQNNRPSVSCIQGRNESSSGGEEREWLNERVTEKKTYELTRM